MMRRLPALVVLLPSLCVAWGCEGYQIVALIAEDQLTPAAKAMVMPRQCRNVLFQAVGSWDTIE